MIAKTSSATPSRKKCFPRYKKENLCDINCSFILFQVNCDQPLEDIYEGTMEMVKVNFFWMSTTRPSLTFNSTSSLGSVAREKVLKPSTRK